MRYTLRLLILLVCALGCAVVLYTKINAWTISESIRIHGCASNAGYVNQIISAPTDKTSNMLLAGFSLFDANTLMTTASLGEIGSCATAVALSHDNKVGAIGTSTGSVLIVNPARKDWVTIPVKAKAAITAIALSPNADLLAFSSADRKSMIWDLRTQTARDLNIPSKPEDDEDIEGFVNWISFTKDGKTVITIGDQIRTWLSEDLTLIRSQRLVLKGFSAVFEDDLNLLIVGTELGIICTIRLEDGVIMDQKTWATKGTTHIHGIDSYHGEIVSAGCDGNVCIGRYNEAEPRTIVNMPTSELRGARFLSSGTRILIGTAGNLVFILKRIRADGAVGICKLPELYLLLISLYLLVKEGLYLRAEKRRSYRIIHGNNCAQKR